jgi:hypothetical protein
MLPSSHLLIRGRCFFVSAVVFDVWQTRVFMKFDPDESVPHIHNGERVLDIGKVRPCKASPSHLASMGQDSDYGSLSRSSNLPVLRLAVPRLAVQGRYKVSLFLRVLSRSVQGIAERPLPCSYNVIQFVCALSRR